MLKLLKRDITERGRGRGKISRRREKGEGVKEREGEYPDIRNQGDWGL